MNDVLPLGLKNDSELHDHRVDVPAEVINSLNNDSEALDVLPIDLNNDSELYDHRVNVPAEVINSLNEVTSTNQKLKYEIPEHRVDIPAEVLNSLNENHSNHAVKHTVSLQVDFTLKLLPHSQISVIPNIELLSTSVKSLNQPETTVNREGERTRNNLLISQPLSVMTTPIRQVPPISKEVPSPTNWVPPLANGETKKEKNIFVISRPPGSDTGRDNTIGELAKFQSVESCNNGHKNIKDTAVENFPLFFVINPDKTQTSDEVNLFPANPTDSSCVLTSQVDDTATDTSGVILKIAGNNKTRESLSLIHI